MVATNLIHLDVRKPGIFKRQYGFFNNEKLIASLDYKSAFNYKAVISIGNKKWQIRSCGFWNKFLEINADQSPFTKLRLEYGWKHKLRFKDGKDNFYIFKRVSTWKNTWAWFNEKDNTPIVQMKSKQLSCRNRGRIELAGQHNEDIYLMILIGWYQLVLYESQAAASAAA